MKSSMLRWSLRLMTALTAILCLSFWVAAQDDADPNSPTPILLSEPGSTRALTAPDGVKLVNLTRLRDQAYAPNSRVVFFATNLAFGEDEGINSLRITVQDAKGRFFRFPVVGLRLYQGEPGVNAIYAITAELSDVFHSKDLGGTNGDTLVGLTWRGLMSNRTRLGINQTGGPIQDDPGAEPTSIGSPKVRSMQKAAATEATDKFSGNRRRFLEQATFGPTDAAENTLRQMGIKAWISDQFNQPYPSATNPYPSDPLKANQGADPTCDGDNVNTAVDVPPTCVRDTYTMYKPQTWFTKEALYGNAQLKHRVAWALAQIWVTSGVDISQGRHMVEYHKVLSNNAFGNYRNLMKEMTLNPTMGDYLSMSLSTRTAPNENYAREIMQLFSVGLFMLNQDGTLQLDGQGQPIPTYTQNEVNNLTKVFTGWNFCSIQASCPNLTVGTVNYIDPMLLNRGVTTPANNTHDLTAKTLLSYTGSTTTNVPACPTTGSTSCAAITNQVSNAQAVANIATYANASLEQAIDNLFNHPNVGPFVSKTLIQHMVTSDPTPAYVGRVAAVFNNNGAGVRGDMKSVIRAILLDPEARGSVKTDPSYGKLREPFQLFTNFGRAFGVRAANGTGQTDGWVVGAGIYTAMAQVPFMSPTVFNFFPPDYVIPGTAYPGPEFAILNTGTTVARANFFNQMVFSATPIAVSNPNFPDGMSFDYSDLQALALADTTGGTLLEELNRRMLHGTMTAQMKSTIQTALNAVTDTDLNTRALNKARQAIYLVATSSQYQVQR